MPTVTKTYSFCVLKNILKVEEGNIKVFQGHGSFFCEIESFFQIAHKHNKIYHFWAADGIYEKQVKVLKFNENELIFEYFVESTYSQK